MTRKANILIIDNFKSSSNYYQQLKLCQLTKNHLETIVKNVCSITNFFKWCTKIVGHSKFWFKSFKVNKPLFLAQWAFNPL